MSGTRQGLRFPAFRQRIGLPAWRRLHRWSAAAFVLGAAHGILAGSDSGTPWMQSLYVVAILPTGELLGLRVHAAWRAARAAVPGAGSARALG